MPKLNSRYPRLTLICLAVAIAISWQHFGASQRASAEPAEPQVARQGALNWMRLQSNGDMIVTATKVPGGWFVCVHNHQPNPNDLGSIGGAFYYPDNLHQWDGGSTQD